MHKMSINRQVVEVTKNEAKEAHRIASMRTAGPEHAQRAADIWMRSAPDDKAAGTPQGSLPGLGPA